jgi:hypothetical protein
MPTLPEQMASQAEFIVNNHTETHYTHDVDINVDTGVYDCDCSEYVGFVLKGVASMHYRLVEASVPYPRPLAADYYLFFVKPDLPSIGGWSRIHALSDAHRGDIVAWQLADSSGDTGHCFFVAETPVLMESGDFAVRVYDSAAVPHYDDTRATGKSGVGSGFINFRVSATGSPSYFQFGPSLPLFVEGPIAIGRIEPLS